MMLVTYLERPPEISLPIGAMISPSRTVPSNFRGESAPAPSRCNKFRDFSTNPVPSTDSRVPVNLILAPQNCEIRLSPSYFSSAIQYKSFHMLSCKVPRAFCGLICLNFQVICRPPLATHGEERSRCSTERRRRP